MFSISLRGFLVQDIGSRRHWYRNSCFWGYTHKRINSILCKSQLQGIVTQCIHIGSVKNSMRRVLNNFVGFFSYCNKSILNKQKVENKKIAENNLETRFLSISYSKNNNRTHWQLFTIPLQAEVSGMLLVFCAMNVQ